MRLPPPQFWRAALAFLLLPGIVAVLVPWLLLRPAGERIAPTGAILLGTGMFLLLWCARDFYVAGKGTLAPWDPPKQLVTTGLYRYSRNPMYVAVLIMLAGWSLGYRSLPLALYTVAVVIAFHLRILYAEEPYLARQHGEQWTRYRSRTNRWLPMIG